MKKNLFVLMTAILMSITTINQSNACTNYLITKGASTDGSTMISYAADSHVLFGELYHWPAATWADDAMLDVYEWDTGKYLGAIKQAKQTYNVVGNMNEYQVAIGETTYGGRSELHDPNAIMDYGSLIYIALQRSKSAREAIKNIADLMDKYGYYSSGESFSISDANEVWIMEMISKGSVETGAVWVARMIPDGYVSGHANHARIGTFPKADGKTSITSKNLDKIFDTKITTVYAYDVIDFARKMKWYKGKDKNFSFSETYAPVDFGGARFCEIRVWSMFDQLVDNMDDYWEYAKGNIEHGDKLANGDKNVDGYATNRMPLWIKPNKKVSVQDMMHFMRNHLEGTELDMSKDVGAGPFNVPYRWRPLTWEVEGESYCNERATATQQTGFSFVAQSRSWLPNEIGGIFWFGVDDASSSVYIPMYSSITKAPHTFERDNGKMMVWSDDAAFWVFNQLSNFAYTRYNTIHPEIAEKQKAFEDGFVAATKEVDKVALTLLEKDTKTAVEYLTNYSCTEADKVTYAWKEFYHYLFMKYMDGNIKTADPGKQNPKLKQPGYSKEFLKQIVDETGDKLKMPKEKGGH
ncbi:MAG: C69 family dipeptidase [Bacteroidales bacterium]|nr:C69 family dipeptidase [Bacteroidales bacterium]